MRPRLGPVVETENRIDDPVQFVGQRNRSGPAAVRPAVEFELLEVDAERLIELGDRSRKNDGAARRVLLHDREVVALGESRDRGHVGRSSPEFLRQVGVLHMARRSLAGGKARDLRLERIRILPAHQHRYLEAFRRIRLADGPCSRKRLSVTADQYVCTHIVLHLCWM